MSELSLPFVLLCLVRLYEMIVIIRILLSWVSVDHNHPIIDWIYRLTEPVLAPAREILMRLLDRMGVQIPIDFSPILVFILIGFLERTLASFL